RRATTGVGRRGRRAAAREQERDGRQGRALGAECRDDDRRRGRPVPALLTARDEIGDDARERLAAVLLQEVPAAGDGRVRLPVRARDRVLEQAVAAAGDRILVAEGGEERPVEPS